MINDYTAIIFISSEERLNKYLFVFFENSMSVVKLHLEARMIV